MLSAGEIRMTPFNPMLRSFCSRGTSSELRMPP